MTEMAQSGEHEQLRRLREGWEEVEAEETRLLREMTIEESFQQLLSLQSDFEPQLQRTESLFRADRLAYLEDLQNKLGRLEEWKKKRRGRSI
ncbi:MAG: hypothetical protein JSV89_17000 [Spirochaetaceae bacterium]|nr:MAG: hypothetical protein JSV89_17000 [Spirochaetaceae bacterium]